MDLFARLRKSTKIDSATAIGAIAAIPLLNQPRHDCPPTQNSRIAPIAVAKANSQKSEIQTVELLARFQLHDCEDVPEFALISRINNICYRLVTVNGREFEEAMTAAAVWVVNNPEHPDERHFIDVLALYRGDEGAIKATPTQAVQLGIELLHDVTAVSVLQCAEQSERGIDDANVVSS